MKETEPEFGAYFADHERLGPMEQLKVSAGELEGLAFVTEIQDDKGLWVYTGYITQEGKKHGLG